MAAQPDRNRSVYVVELDAEVLSKKPFAQANPQYEEGAPCVYVGMTALSPEARYAQHKAGLRASKYVRQYGLHLSVSECVSGLTYKDAVNEEVRKADELRARGWAVWQN